MSTEEDGSYYEDSESFDEINEERKKRLLLLEEYEKFLKRKNYNITKLRETAADKISKKNRKSKALEMLREKSKKEQKERTKDEYKQILRAYYLGNEQDVIRYEKDVEESEERDWYEWTYCYAFKNPDAQKKESEVDCDDAFDQLDGLFKEMPMPNDIQKSRMHTAHQEVLREILEQMCDQDREIKKYKGGRFTKIEDKKEEDEGNKKQEEFDINPKWIDNGPYPKDLSTLVYNIFLYRINVGLSLESRTVMSVDGSHIYIVIRADELDLKRVAEESKYTMQLAIGLTDLTSLEPCDYLYKPFRKCQNKPDDILQTEKTLEEYFSIVEGNVKDTLEDNPNKHQVKESVIGNMSNAELITYKEYLRIMKEGFADFQAHTLNRPHMKGVHLRTMAVNGLEEANREGAEKGGAKLYNLWQRLGWKHRIGAFVDFVDEPDTEYLWRKYIADETLKRSLFRDVDRIKLTDIILNKTIYNKSLFSSGYVSCGFAFHNEFDLFGKPRFSHEERENIMEDQEVELQAKVLFAENIPRGLMKSWRCVLPSPSKIRNYFGEKIAFYFHFLNFLTVALIIPGIIGIIAFVLQIVFDVDDSGTDGGIADYNNAIFTLILVIWSAAFYEYWKRQEVKYSVLWGQTDFEEDQVQRVEFFGIMRRSPIDDKREMYFSSFARMFRMLISTCVTLFMMCLTIALILGTFALKEYLIEEFSGDFIEPYIPTIISTLNAFQIYFFNQVYNYIAFLLTKFENHKTQTVFERSLIVKTFTFSFVNGFNSLFYIAFIKQEREGCIDDVNGTLVQSKDNNCFRELYVQLRSIFIIAILYNLMEIGLPIMFNFLAKRSRKKFYEKAKDSEDPNVKLMLRIEKNMERGVYAFKDIDGTYWDYLELMRQLGYILLFGLSFPPCLILAFINNVLEHQVDKAKLVYFKRRPLPLGGSSIGVWRIILYFISIMGIFTQAAILCMTAETFTKDGDDKFVQFLWASLIFVIIRWMIGYLIDDFPLKYRYVLKRHRHIVNKFLVGLPESSRFDDLFNEKTKLSVHSIVNDKLYAADSCNISNEALSKSFDSGVLKVVTSIEATKNNAVKVEDIKLQEKTPGSTLKVPEKGSDEYDASNNVNGSSGSYNSNSDSYFDNSDEEYDDPSGEGEDSSGSSAQESSYMSQSSIPDSSEEEPVDSSEEESKRGN